MNEAQTPPLPDAGMAAPAAVVPAPPSFGRQAAQLIVIPALIVLACVGMATLFGKLAGAQDSIDNHLAKLRQSSGAGRLAFNVQDPRYKDRWLAAYNVATLIPGMKDPAERQQVSRQLVEILNQQVGPQEDMLQMYLLMAVGQLGGEGSMQVIQRGLESEHATVRQGAVRAVLSHPDAAAARAAVPQLAVAVGDSQPQIAAEAAAALGHLARGDDAAVIPALHAGLAGTGGRREVSWNAAVALARLGDERGSERVANLLLDRAALAQLPAGESGPESRVKLSPAAQDRMILQTLMAAEPMNDERIWVKITLLAEGDPSRVVQAQARKLLQRPRTEQ